MISVCVSRRIRSSTIGLLLTATFAAFFSLRSASAHAFLVRTDPPDGAVLNEAPRQMRLVFSEQVPLELATVELVDGNGNEYPLPPLRQSEDDPAELVLDLPTLGPNVYRLNWQTVSDEDLHVNSGSVVFGVQQTVTAGLVSSVNTWPHLLEVLVRWGNLIALTVLVGALILVKRVQTAGDYRRHTRRIDEYLGYLSQARSRLLRLGIIGGLSALLLGGGLLFIQLSSVVALSGASRQIIPQVLSSTGYGPRWLVQQALLVVIVLVGMWILRSAGSQRAEFFREQQGIAHPSAVSGVGLRFGELLLGALLLGLALVQTMNSHAAESSAFSPVGVILEALHLLAAGVLGPGGWWLYALL